MKTNLILISFLERIYKAKKNNWKVDWKALLDVQIEVSRLEKDNEELKRMINQEQENSIKIRQEASKSESRRLSAQNEVDVSEGIIKSLKEEINNINENLEL